MINYGTKETFSDLNVNESIGAAFNVNSENSNIFVTAKLFQIVNAITSELSIFYYQRESNNQTRVSSDEMFPSFLRLELYRSFFKEQGENPIFLTDYDGKVLVFTHAVNYFYINEEKGLKIEYQNNQFKYYTSLDSYFVYSEGKHYPSSFYTDGVEQYSITLNSDNKISSITFKNNVKATFSYSNGYVNGISVSQRLNINSNYNEIEYIQFVYSNSNKIIEIKTKQNQSGTVIGRHLKLDFESVSDRMLFSDEKELIATKITLDSTSKKPITISKCANSDYDTEIHPISLTYDGRYTYISDSFGNQKVLMFDDSGLLINELCDNGLIICYKYDEKRNLIYKSPITNINSSGSSSNLVTNGYFVNGVTGWSVEGSLGVSDFSTDISFSDVSFVLKSINATKISQTINYLATPDEKFTLSCIVIGSNDGSAHFVVKATLLDYDNNVISVKEIKSRFTSNDQRFEQIALDITPYESFSSVSIELYSEDNSSHFHIGAVQLKKCAGSLYAYYDQRGNSTGAYYFHSETGVLYDLTGKLVASSNNNGSSLVLNRNSTNTEYLTKKDFNVSEKSYFNLKQLPYKSEVYNGTNLASLTETTYSEFLIDHISKDGVIVTYYSYNADFLIDEINLTINDVDQKAEEFSYVWPYLLNHKIRSFDGSVYDNFTYTYNSKGKVSAIDNRGVNYSFLYNDILDCSSVKLNNDYIRINNYNSSYQISSEGYSSSNIFNFYYLEYNNYNQITNIKKRSRLIYTTIYSFLYNSYCRLSSATDYTYSYYDNGDIKKVESRLSSLNYHYYSDDRSLTVFSCLDHDSYNYYTTPNQSLYLSDVTQLNSLITREDVSTTLFLSFKTGMTVLNKATLIGRKIISPSNSSTLSIGDTSIPNTVHKIRENCAYFSGFGYSPSYSLENNGDGYDRGFTAGGYFYLKDNSSYWPNNSLYKNLLEIKSDTYFSTLSIIKVSGNLQFRISHNGSNITTLPITPQFNTWFYVSMTQIYSDSTGHRIIRLRIDDNVYYYQFNGVVISQTGRNDSFSIFGSIGQNHTDSYQSIPADLYGDTAFLFMSNNGKALSEADEKDIYLTAKEYLFATSINDTSISSNLFAGDIISDNSNLPNLDVIPLTNSFVSMSGNKPIKAEKSFALNYYNDSSFRFDINSNQYAYFAQGKPLIYRYSGSYSAGSISLSYNLDLSIQDNKNKCLLNVVLSNSNINMKLYFRNGSLYYKCGILAETQLSDFDSSKNRITFSWKKMTNGTYNLYFYQDNNNLGTYPISNSNTTDGVTFSLGNTFNELTDFYPLFGCIHSVAIISSKNTNVHYVYDDVIKSSYSFQNSNYKLTNNVTIGDTYLSSHLYDNSHIYNSFNTYLPKEEELDLKGNYSYRRNYSYDSLRRITGITYKKYLGHGSSATEVTGDRLTLGYTYDALSRITSFTRNGSTVNYNYDIHGNITNVTFGGTPTKSFTYDSSNRMTAYNGQTFTYSTKCKTNIETQVDSGVTTTYAYDGRKLTSIKKTNSSTTLLNMTFTYDYRNRRLTKNDTILNKSHAYFYDENKLIEEVVLDQSTSPATTYRLRFFYDDKGKLSHLEYNDSYKYFYDYDAFGNIVGLYDVNGNIVVQYEYDPWGNVVIVSDTTGTLSLSTLNPFLYKTYYYDHETNFYYCLTRYYVPLWMRWLNGDAAKFLDDTTPCGCNLFVYCNNNPTMLFDPYGVAPDWVYWLMGGLSIAASIALSFAFGPEIFIGTMIGATLGFIFGAWDMRLNTFDWSDAAKGFGWGALIGLASSFLGYSFSYLKYADISKGASTILQMIGSGETAVELNKINYYFEKESVTTYQLATSFFFGMLPTFIESISNIYSTIVEFTVQFAEGLIHEFTDY